MGTCTVKAPIAFEDLKDGLSGDELERFNTFSAQLRDRLLTGYSTAGPDAEHPAELVVECDRMTDEDLAAALKGLHLDPDFVESPPDEKAHAEAAAQTEAAQARRDAEEHLRQAQSALDALDVAEVDRAVAIVAGRIDERRATLAEVEDAYLAAAAALDAHERELRDEDKPTYAELKRLQELREAENLAQRRAGAGAQDVHYSVVDLQLARDAAAKWKREVYQPAEAELLRAKRALSDLEA